MANIKSQIKRNRQTLKQRERNKEVRSRLRTRIKAFETALAAGDKDAAADAYRVAARELDIAAAHKVVHKNKAANKKSRLSKRLNAAS